MMKYLWNIQTFYGLQDHYHYKPQYDYKSQYMGDKNDMRVGLKDTIKITQSDLKKE